MDRYHWNILDLSEMRWENFSEMSPDVIQKVYFSEEEDRHEYGGGFLVHKDNDECGLKLPTSLQQTNLNPLERSSFECHDHTC